MATATLELTTSSRPYIFKSLGTPTRDNYNESSDFPIDSKYEFTDQDIFPGLMGLMLIQQKSVVKLNNNIDVRIKYCDSDCTGDYVKKVVKLLL